MITTPSRFKHYKGGEYTIKEFSVLEETLELIILYEDSSGNKWSRPASDFFAIVEIDGKKVPRFRVIPNTDQSELAITFDYEKLCYEKLCDEFKVKIEKTGYSEKDINFDKRKFRHKIVITAGDSGSHAGPRVLVIYPETGHWDWHGNGEMTMASGWGERNTLNDILTVVRELRDIEESSRKKT